ncbi:Wzz/FepE/Etk N-terminal domain-containing protein [Alkaliflexus imshenetskii]|uniref:Wzz/FepE/Etk N-terminal domain-containing protein n=1 Tax=Alkaliflexus imshenetskii TaxID=286730 RepID=UPI0004B86EAB|nr:Wzz/FepE/Etk N-terminal domain-containing protein [Alkaliflexus imshenetskii]
MDNPIGQVKRGNNIDLIALLNTFWFERKWIVYAILTGVFLALIITFSMPVRYKAGAVLLPQTDGMASIGQLGSLASLAGVDINSMLGGNSEIAPEIYPYIMGSYPFLNDLLSTIVYSADRTDSILLYDRIRKELERNPFKLIKSYTILLPWTIKDLIIGGKKGTIVSFGNEIVFYDEEKQAVLDVLTGLMDVRVDRRNKLISINISADEPFVAAQIAERARILLQEYVIRYKTRRVSENLQFIEERFEEKKKEHDSLRHELLSFRDANRFLVAERAELRLADLENRYALANSLYQTLAQQLEQARLAVKNETPVFSVIEPVKVPVRKTSPRHSINLVIGFVIGAIVGVMAIVFKIVRFYLKL